MAILKIRDENGEVREVLALRGPKGESGTDAYAKAKECGYEGSEDEFYTALGRNGGGDYVSKSGDTMTGPLEVVQNGTIAGVIAEQASATILAFEEGEYSEHRRQLSLCHSSDLSSALMLGEVEGDTGKFYQLLHTGNRELVYKTFTATVTTTWDEYPDCYYQDITVTGILETDNPIVDIMAGNDNSANVLYSEAICKVFRIATYDNKIRLYATEAIGTAFPIRLKVVR